ncbi:hypothetical protein Patl1_27192 [Pistacia atlantica]|uniref:Uncharacterized protein n=1 Tax=Pistacia atlantica TaxID=434234 RepID=A0ACC1BHB0_9ROSI|nr:hypothetical protein Patl1_27192 [Pistacia atlantica]
MITFCNKTLLSRAPFTLSLFSFKHTLQMARSALDEVSDSGSFVRPASTFCNSILRDPSSQFPAESGRYHLYISYACPWACRCLSFLKIKGLKKAITFTVWCYSVKPIWEKTKEGDEH